MPTMLMQRCVLIIWLSLLAFSQTRAESPVLRRLGVAEGLPAGRVLDLAEDRQHRLWIATLDGVASFDGYRLDVFRYQNDRADSLPSNTTQVLMIDRDDRLWVGLEGQGVVRHLGDGRFERPPVSNPQARSMDAWALAEDDRGGVWVGGYQSGILVLDASMALVRRYSAETDGLLSNITLSLFRDRAGAMWIASERGLQRFKDGRFDSALFEGENKPLMVLRMVETPEGILAATRAGVFSSNGGLQFTRHALVDVEGASALLTEGNGELWIGSRQGLFRVAADERLHWGPQSGSELGKQSVSALHRDQEGGVWIATDGAGVFRLPPQWRRIRAWLHDGRDLRSHAVQAASFAAAGALYTAGSDGVLERIDLEDGEVDQIFTPKSTRSLSVNALVLSGEQLWMAHARGLERYSVEAHSSGRLDNPTILEGTAWVDLVAAEEGAVWGLTPSELLLISSKGELQRRWIWPERGDFGQARRLSQDASGALWIIGSGVMRLESPSAQLQLVDSLGQDAVDAMAVDGRNEIWLARKSGLQRYQLEGGQWLQVGKYPFPGSVEAGDLWTDAEHHVWVITPRGLLHFDPLRERYQQYGAFDGLPDQAFRANSLVADEHRQFAAATLSGLLLVDPNAFERPLAVPAVQAQALQWLRQGKPLSAASAPPQLEFDDREIRFAARALSFANPEAWRFRHRIESFDTQWVELGSVAERRVSSLPPGDYAWELQIAGPWSDWQRAVGGEVRVLPPWWAQPWARALQLCAFALGLWVMLRWVKRRALRRAHVELQETERRWALQANEQKTKFVQTLAHELRTPMTGVMGMAELLAESALDDRQREQVENLRRAGDLLLRQLNETLDLARIEAGSLELREAPFCPHQVVVQTVGVMRPLALRKRLELPVDIAPEVPAFIYGDADRVQQILLNLVGNAIKFTHSGSVSIRICREEQFLIWQVVDTGPGLSEQQQAGLFGRFAQPDDSEHSQRPGGSGLGLNISRELAVLMGGELDLRSSPGEGTTVRLRLPLRIAEMPASQPALASSPSPAASLSVLLVEDDPDAAAAIVGLLELARCEVEHASTPLQALSMMATSSYHLGLIDLDLPGMDGRQLAQLMRAQGIDVPLWAVTARLQEGLAEQIKADGLDGVLAKPVERTRLNALLSRVAGSAFQA